MNGTKLIKLSVSTKIELTADYTFAKVSVSDWMVSVLDA